MSSTETTFNFNLFLFNFNESQTFFFILYLYIFYFCMHSHNKEVLNIYFARINIMIAIKFNFCNAIQHFNSIQTYERLPSLSLSHTHTIEM